MLDLTYRYEEALRVGRAIEEMVSTDADPLAARTLQLRQLKQKLDIPILATEFPVGGLITIRGSSSATDFCAAMSHSRATSQPLVKTAHLAEAFRMNPEVHHGGNSLNNVAICTSSWRSEHRFFGGRCRVGSRSAGRRPRRHWRR
jgi:hypothetical protein